MILKKEITDLFGRELIQLSDKKRNEHIQRAFRYWRKQGFPFPSLTREEIVSEFNKLKNSRMNKISKNKILNASTVGLRLANSFQPQMWQLKAQGHKDSPLDHFNNDETLQKLLERAINFWPNRRCWCPHCIRDILRIYSGGRVANFRPTIARTIINGFSKTNDRVLDFCAGFGGRLLGAITLKRHYVGVDSSNNQIQGLKKMMGKLNPICAGTAELYCQCAEDIMKEMKTNYFDLIFTSPPYYNLEKYDDDLNQSYRKYQTYQDWKNNFLKIVIQQAKRILRPNGFLVINISNTNKFPIATDLVDIATSLFPSVRKLYLYMHSRPVQRENGINFRTEPIFVFKNVK